MLNQKTINVKTAKIIYKKLFPDKILVWDKTKHQYYIINPNEKLNWETKVR